MAISIQRGVRPTFVQYRRGVVILLDGYTYSKSDKVNWYCSRRTTASCKAKVKLTPDEKYIDCLVGVHDHYRERFVVSPDGILIKLSTTASIVPALPRLPTNQEEFSGSHENGDDSDGSISRTMALAEALISSCKSKQDERGATASRSRGVRDEGIDVQVTHKLQILEAKLDTCVYLLGKLVTEVKDLKQRSVSNNNGNSGLEPAISAEVESHLKLDTQEGVSAFETRLKTCKKFENEFVRKVKQVGGANGKDFTERALAFIFSNKFAKENTWEGKITKYKVNTLKVIDICEKVILEKFPTWDKAEFSKAGTNWFRLGNQRAGEQPKQVTKKTTQMDKNNQKSNGNRA